MGCLFGKKQQESEVEINLQGSLSLKPKPFNEINDIKFLGYPHYSTLTAFVNTLLENNINTWLPYKQQLIDHQIKIDKYLEILNGSIPIQQILIKAENIALEIEEVPPDFNLNFKNCLIVDLQNGTFSTSAIDTSYFVIITTNKQEYSTMLPSKEFLEWNEAFIFEENNNKSFQLQLMQEHKGKQTTLGESITFLFDELRDQIIHEKSVKIKWKTEIIGLLQIKCQLVNNIDEFALKWKSELITRREQISRIIQKINDGGDSNDIAFQSLMSQNSLQNLMTNRLASAGQASLIPVKATGNIGSDFFKQPQVVGSSLQLLKKKQRHNELREKGYLVADPKEREEIDMDLPFYEVFDPPNSNYLKVFHPSNLQGKVAYNYHSPDFEQNEVFLISKEDQQIADQLLKGAQENARRKEAILLKMNQNYQREKEIKELREKQIKQNEMINQLKQEKFNKKSVTFKDQNKKTKK